MIPWWAATLKAMAAARNSRAGCFVLALLAGLLAPEALAKAKAGEYRAVDSEVPELTELAAWLAQEAGGEGCAEPDSAKKAPFLLESGPLCTGGGRVYNAHLDGPATGASAYIGFQATGPPA